MLPRQCQGQGSRYTIPPVVGQSRWRSQPLQKTRARQGQGRSDIREAGPRGQTVQQGRARQPPALLFRTLIRGMIPGEHNGIGRGSMGKPIPGGAGASAPCIPENNSISGATLLPAGEKHDHRDMLNQGLIGENSSLALMALPPHYNETGYNRIRAEKRLSSKAPRREAPCRTSTSPYRSCLASGWLLQSPDGACPSGLTVTLVSLWRRQRGRGRVRRSTRRAWDWSWSLR